MIKKRWYKIDNMGIFYSSLIDNKVPAVFRYAVTLNEMIDKNVLQLALNNAIKMFPNFNVRLRNGLFWHYLETIKKENTVMKEELPICFGLNNRFDGYLYRVCYYKQRINFEVSHIISDGRGSLIFFKAIIYNYLKIKYGLKNIENDYDGSDYEKIEDSFDKYYTKEKVKLNKKEKVYRYHQKKIKDNNITYMEYHLPTDKVLNLAHKYNTTLTSLLTAILIDSIKGEMKELELEKTIKIDIPVDLRGYFKSSTSKNFFGLTSVSYKFSSKTEDFSNIINSVSEQLKTGTMINNLKTRTNKMVRIEKNVFVRFIPLYIKDLVIKLFNVLTSKFATTSLSNIGIIKVEPELEKYIKNFSMFSTTGSFKFMICSYKNDLCIGYSSLFYNNNIMKNFCRYFSNEGIYGQINTNMGDI